MSDKQLKAATEIITSVLGCKSQDVSANTSVGSLPQWDSIAHMNIILAFEENLGRQMKAEEIASLESVANFASVLASGNDNG